MTLTELRQRRAALITEARQLYEERQEDGAMGAEDQTQWDSLMDRADELRAQVARAERMEEAEAEIVQPANDAIRPEPETEERATGRGSDEYRAAFDTALRHGTNRLSGAQYRALQADSDIAGGYLLPPEMFVNELIQAVDNAVFIRQWATVHQVGNADSLGVPSLDADPADADWTTELATGSEDSTMALGKRDLKPHPLAKRIKVSRKLLAKVPSAETLVRDRLAYKFGVTWEKAGLTGSGSGQPLGVFTASDNGISTSRDASTGNSTTAVAVDGLIEAKYTLKSQYWPRAKWLGHRDFWKMISKLKDGDGQYLWRESVRAGEPDRLLNIPAHISEYAPNTFTTGLYVGILGDFSHYWIADSMAFELQRLEELYAETNQIGLIGRLESDGMPVLEEAFVRVTLA